MFSFLENLITRFIAYFYPMPTDLSVAPEMPVQPVTLSNPTVTTPVVPQVSISHLDTFCTAIRDFEGGPGDLNYTNNNPGNARCSPEGYLPKYGDVQCVETASGKFAKFPTYALGWEYLQALVMEMVNTHPTWDFVDFFNVYSPTGDNNDPTQYALFVAKRCGVGITTILKTYLG